MALADQLNALTTEYIKPEITDQVLTSNPFFKRLWESRIEKNPDVSFEIPIFKSKTDNVTRFTGSEVLNVNPANELTNASLNWVFYSWAINIPIIELRKNSGPEGKVDLLRAKSQVAMLSAKDDIGTDLWSDGSTTNSLTGFQAIVDDGTNTAIYAGINRSTHTYWKAKYLANSSVNRDLTLKLMARMYGSVTEENARPTDIVARQDIYDVYEQLIQPQQRFNTSGMGDAGFESLGYRGTPWTVDSHVAANEVDFLNRDYIDLYVDPEWAFSPEPFTEPYNQKVLISKILLGAMLVCTAPRFQGRIVDVKRISD